MDDADPAERRDADARRGELGGRRQRLLVEVSRAMVKLYKEQFGRGPVRTRSHWAGPDILLCTLEQTLTPAERRLRAMGETQRLRDMRTFFQYATADAFVEPVEKITGRKVRSFVSGMDTDEDIAVELFIFHPRRGATGDAGTGPEADRGHA